MHKNNNPILLKNIRVIDTSQNLLPQANVSGSFTSTGSFGSIVAGGVGVNSFSSNVGVGLTSPETILHIRGAGDKFRVLRNENLPVGITTSQESNRTVKQILGADLVETDIYTGLGVDDTNNKPVRWEKQKVDIILNGEVGVQELYSYDADGVDVSESLWIWGLEAGPSTSMIFPILVDISRFENAMYDLMDECPGIKSKY